MTTGARFFWLLPLMLLGGACQPVLRTTQFTPPALTERPKERIASRQWANFIPDPEHPEHLPMRYLRINFHVMDNAAGNAHQPADTVRLFLRKLLDLANAALDANERNWRSPEGTPVLPKRYRYVLTPQPVPGDDGIYFHYDDAYWFFVSQGKNRNNANRKVIDQYAVGADSIVNIFIQVHPPDSIASPHYRANAQGIALGVHLKMAGLLEFGEPPENFDGLLNHEVGHILGLGHAWVEDGCPDTENHPNRCWTWSREGPCRDQASNNMMDYNAYQAALTPCQIGKIHAGFSWEKNPVRACLVPAWCALNAESSIVIRDSVTWTGARDLEGHLFIAPGGALRLSSRVSFPPGGRLVVQPGGRLWLDGARLHNACGQSWKGIEVQSLGKATGFVGMLRPSVLDDVGP